MIVTLSRPLGEIRWVNQTPLKVPEAGREDDRNGDGHSGANLKSTMRSCHTDRAQPFSLTLAYVYSELDDTMVD